MEDFMTSFPYQAVAFDLDDTLLRDDLSISDRTVSLLRALSSSGVRIIPASGRAQQSMMPFLKRLSCADLYITCNGAEIRDGSSHELIHGEFFSAELGREIAAFGKKHHCYAQTYADEYFFYNEESVWAERYASASVLKGIHVGDLETFIQEPRNKILMMADDAKIASMLAEAGSLFAGRVSVTCSKPWFLEFNPLGATKGAALKQAAKLLNLDVSGFIAFGDSLNDLSMLQIAGRGVLMENGRRELRPLTDDICPSNQKDGVAEYLARIWEASA